MTTKTITVILKITIINPSKRIEEFLEPVEAATACFKMSIGIYCAKNCAKDELVFNMNINIFFNSLQALELKLANATPANPSSKIDLIPPIILKYYSKTLRPKQLGQNIL